MVFDHAVRCVPGKDGVADAIEPCRPFLAQTIAEAKPTKILCFGTHAAASVLGRGPSTLDVRRGYSWIGLDTDNPVPVFLLMSPIVAMRNRIIRNEWFEPDVRWALTEQPTYDATNWKHTVRLVSTHQEAREAVESLAGCDWTSLDCEWAGHPYNKDHVLLSVALTPVKDDVLLDTFVFSHRVLANPLARAALLPWITNPKAPKVGANLKADVLAIHSYFGVFLRGQVGDTRFMRRILEADARADLATMGELVGLGGHKREMAEAETNGTKLVRSVYRKTQSPTAAVEAVRAAFGETGVSESHIKRLAAGDNPKTYNKAFVSVPLLHQYNARDTVTTAYLHQMLSRRLQEDDADLAVLWRDLALPVASALARVEAWGMPVDRVRLAEFGAYIQEQLDSVSLRFVEFGYNPADPDSFNPDSSAHVADLLFKKLGITPKAFTATGKPSTDKDAMKEYAKQHKVAADLLRWRKLSKLKGTYADGDNGDGGLLMHVRDDGRIHPSIHPDGARTGRTSSSGPNLQNIPRADTADGKMLRDCFAAPPGWVFVELDHSQLELRIAADQSGDPEMLAIFHSGEDYHLRTARMIAPQAWPGVDPASITKESNERTAAKTVNFGVLYDDDPYGLAMRLGVPVEQATRIRDALFGKFKRLGSYIKERVQESTRTGYARTWWNGRPARRRPLWGIAEAEDSLRKTARRGSWNTPIQGTGSDYLLAGLVEVVNWIESEAFPAQVCVPIHDAILSLVREDVLEEFLYVVPRLMTSFPTRNGVPLVVDGKMGKSWGSMEKVKLR